MPNALINTDPIVSQNFFRHGDRTQQVNNEQVDKFVTDEFLVGVVYDRAHHREINRLGGLWLKFRKAEPSSYIPG